MTPAHALVDIREQHAPFFPCDALQEGPIRASAVQVPVHQGVALGLSRYLLSCCIIFRGGLTTQVGPDWLDPGLDHRIKPGGHSVAVRGLPSTGAASWGWITGHPAHTQGATFVSDGDRDGWLRQSFFKDAYR